MVDMTVDEKDLRTQYLDQKKKFLILHVSIIKYMNEFISQPSSYIRWHKLFTKVDNGLSNRIHMCVWPENPD